MSARERRLESALEFASDALVTLDATGVVEHLNRAAELLLGVDRSAHIGKSFTELFAEPASQEIDVVTLLARAIVQGTNTEGRIAPRRASTLLLFALRSSTDTAGGTAKGATLRLRADPRSRLPGADGILNPIAQPNPEEGALLASVPNRQLSKPFDRGQLEQAVLDVITERGLLQPRPNASVTAG